MPSCLNREVPQLGARVGERTVRRVVHQLRAEAVPIAPATAQKGRDGAALLRTHPDGRNEEGRVLRKRSCNRRPDLDQARHLVVRFSEMAIESTGSHRLQG